MRLQTQVAPEIQKRLLLSRVEAESLKSVIFSARLVGSGYKEFFQTQPDI